jgi:hypothetical protein
MLMAARISWMEANTIYAVDQLTSGRRVGPISQAAVWART